MSIILNGSAGVTTNSGAVYDGISRGTAVTASGTSVDFTSIPSWVKKITVMFDGVSTNGTSSFLVQLGDSGGIENTGYIAGSTYSNNTSATTSSTAGYILNYGGFASAATTIQGVLSVNNLNTNTWVASHAVSGNTGPSVYGGGSKTLSATLDRIRITTVNGTDTFDAGSINILYE